MTTDSYVPRCRKLIAVTSGVFDVSNFLSASWRLPVKTDILSYRGRFRSDSKRVRRGRIHVHMLRWALFIGREWEDRGSNESGHEFLKRWHFNVDWKVQEVIDRGGRWWCTGDFQWWWRKRKVEFRRQIIPKTWCIDGYGLIGVVVTGVERRLVRRRSGIERVGWMVKKLAHNLCTCRCQAGWDYCSELWG